MNLEKILSDEKAGQVPTWDEALWLKTDFYNLHSQTQFYGNAHLTMLQKEFAINNSTALLTLLIRICNEHKLLPQSSLPALSNRELLNILTSSGFFIETLKGIEISVNEFWNNFSEITTSILQSPGACLLKNGKLTETANLINLSDIIKVFAFANSWNSRQYFIESKTHWIFFDWATMM